MHPDNVVFNVKDTLDEILVEIKRLLMNERDISLTLRSDKVCSVTSLQKIFGFRSSQHTRGLLELIMGFALNAEKKAPGAFFVMLKTLVECCERGVMINTPSESQEQNQPTLETFMSVLRHHVHDAKIRELLIEAINIAGFRGQITIEKTKSRSHIEVVSGHRFRLKPAFNVANIVVNNPFVAFFDGYVESVSEVHRLLQDTFEAKASLVIFCRGMSNDVLNTIKVNFDRGLIVVPIIVDFDLNGINTLVDLATLLASDVISSTKGQLISTTMLHDLTQTSKIEVLNDWIVVFSDSNNATRITNHIAQIQEKRDGLTDESFIDLLNARIKTLLSNQVVIRLNDDGGEFVVRSQQIDNGLRAFKSMLTFGAHDDGTLVATMMYGKFYAAKCLSTLSTIGAIVIT